MRPIPVVVDVKIIISTKKPGKCIVQCTLQSIFLFRILFLFFCHVLWTLSSATCTYAKYKRTPYAYMHGTCLLGYDAIVTIAWKSQPLPLYPSASSSFVCAFVLFLSFSWQRKDHRH
jgi:hypothetical protein